MAELNFGLLTPPGSQSIGNAFVQGMDQAAVARAQENQNALSQYTLSKAKREDELNTQLLGDLRNATTNDEIYRAYQRAGKGDVASRLRGEQLTQDKTRLEIAGMPATQAKTKADTAVLHGNIMEREANVVLANPTSARAMQAVVNFGKATGQDVTQELKTLTELGDDPNKIAAWARGHAIKGKDLVAFSTPKPTPTNVGNKIVFLDMNPNSPTFKSEVIPSQNIGAGPGTVPANLQASVALANAQDQGVVVPGAAPAQPGTQVTQAAFPRITPQVQAERNAQQIAILNAELAKSNPADQQRIRAEIAKLSTGNPFAASGANPLPEVNNMPGAAAAAAAPTVNAMNAPSPREIREARTPKFDATAGGYVYPPSAENPQGKFVPVSGLDGKPLNEAQGNATAYGLRMKEAQATLDNLANPKTGNPTLRGAAVENIPLAGGAIGKILPSFLGGTSEQQQQVKQAKSNFITAVLRKESGAVISDSEFVREDEKYFPQFNDSQKVIKQKEDARNLAITAMKFQAGPGAKEIDKYVPSIFREKTAPNLSEPPAGAVRVKAK